MPRALPEVAGPAMEQPEASLRAVPRRHPTCIFDPLESMQQHHAAGCRALLPAKPPLLHPRPSCKQTFGPYWSPPCVPSPCPSATVTDTRAWSNGSEAAGLAPGSGIPVLLPALVALLTSSTWWLLLLHGLREALDVQTSPSHPSPLPAFPRVEAFQLSSSIPPRDETRILPAPAGERNERSCPKPMAQIPH